MATASLGSDPWLLSLNIDVLRARLKERSWGAGLGHRPPAVFRVPPHIRKVRPQCYDVEILPLGLYNRDFRNQTPIDQLKLNLLSVFLDYLGVDQQGWKTFCTEVATPPATGNVADLEEFYADDVGQSFKTLDLPQSALIMDAFVVVAYFIWNCERYSSGSWFSAPPLLVRQTIEIFKRANGNALETALDHDIFWLCENQIPLFLVENVWNKVASHAGYHITSTFHSVLSENLTLALSSSSLGSRNLYDEVIRLELSTCDHLLQCLHKAIAPAVAPRPTTEAETSNDTTTYRSTCRRSLKQLVAFGPKIRGLGNRNLAEPTFPALPSASELHGSGIVFRGTDGGEIRLVKSFHRLTAILYIPKILIVDSTEKHLRNMCVYELSTTDQDATGGITPYVDFMDELINEEEDVRLLMQGKQPVITENCMGDNKVVVVLFTNVLENFGLARSDWRLSIVKAEIFSWYSHRWRRHFVGFFDRFVKAPWLFVSLIAATILLVLTLLQTIYTMWGFYTQY